MRETVFAAAIALLRTHWWPGPTFPYRPAYIVHARNEITQRALLRGDWDDFLWIDSDIVPDMNLPVRIAELVESEPYLAPSGGVICGSYSMKEAAPTAAC